MAVSKGSVAKGALFSLALIASAVLGTAIGSAGGEDGEWGCSPARIGYSLFTPAEGGGYASADETLAALAPLLAEDGPLDESAYARALASRAGQDRYEPSTGKLFIDGWIEAKIVLTQLADGTWTLANLQQCMRPPTPEEASPFPTPTEVSSVSSTQPAASS
jgi:hypothetical protein